MFWFVVTLVRGLWRETRGSCVVSATLEAGMPLGNMFWGGAIAMM